MMLFSQEAFERRSAAVPSSFSSLRAASKSHRQTPAEDIARILRHVRHSVAFRYPYDREPELAAGQRAPPLLSPGGEQRRYRRRRTYSLGAIVGMHEVRDRQGAAAWRPEGPLP